MQYQVLVKLGSCCSFYFYCLTLLSLFRFTFMTHLDGNLELLVLLFKLLRLGQAAGDGEAGHQHRLCVLDPSHHLNKENIVNQPKWRIEEGKTNTNPPSSPSPVSVWNVASWTHSTTKPYQIIPYHTISYTPTLPVWNTPLYHTTPNHTTPLPVWRQSERLRVERTARAWFDESSPNPPCQLLAPVNF